MRSTRNAIRTITLLGLATFGLAALAGCQDAPAAIFRPESTGAAAIHDLSVYLLAIAAIVLVGVEATLLVAILRFRNRPEEMAVQTHGNPRLETGWTVATAVAVFVILGMTIKTMGEATSVPASALPEISAFPGDTVVLRVVGYQWWWRFEYPQSNVVTANEVHIPVGRPIKLQLESADVIHSFWVPRLGGKTDTVPGQINYANLLATTPGTYEGECGEFCGAQHARMGFKVIAEPVAEFSAWIKSQQALAAQPATEARKAGEQAFQQSCGGCHAVAGTGAGGTSGPDLTHFGSRLSLGANTLPNTPENLTKWIADPQEVKPGNLMPTVKLDKATVDQLVAYLEDLK
ncbi:MAG: cytochrome c oxidase subunit II [Chloroflexota bacterium]